MYEEIKDYLSPQDFALTYINKKGKKGVSRAYIYQLIESEKKNPGTTGIDVLCIGGNNYYVKYSKTKK